MAVYRRGLDIEVVQMAPVLRYRMRDALYRELCAAFDRALRQYRKTVMAEHIRDIMLKASEEEQSTALDIRTCQDSMQ